MRTEVKNLHPLARLYGAVSLIDKPAVFPSGAKESRLKG